MRQFLLLILYVLISTVGLAQSDSTAVHPRYPSRAKVEKYKNDRQYRYDRNATPPQSPLARLWDWLLRRFLTVLESSAYRNFWQYVLLAIVVAAAVRLIVKVIALNGILGKPAPTKISYNTQTENIHEIDFTGDIQRAIDLKDYRLAVRLLYLRTLKDLTDRNLIDWQPNKTNRSYLREIIGKPELHAPFNSLTQQFEYIWYGDFPVNEGSFELIKHDFNGFSGKL